MLFSLTNLKRRSVRDPDGEFAVVPKLLHGRTSVKLVEQAIALFSSIAGKRRSEYDPRTLEAVFADYRIARCIESCLLRYYAFVQPQFSDYLTDTQLAHLAELGLGSPVQIRTALWDAANAVGGFVTPTERDSFLQQLALEWGLPPDASLVSLLLTLDSEQEAVLTPLAGTPLPADIVRLYNRGAVQTLLAHSTHVEIIAKHLPGVALKRMYFVAKRRGVLVEIERPGDDLFRLVMFGPEEAFGTAEKYGRRLADVTLSLLRSLLIEEPDAEVSATAYLVLHERPYRFHVTREILSRLEYASVGVGNRLAEAGAAYSVGGSTEATEDTEEPSFDSILEAKYYKEHKSLEKGGYTHGWRVEREPDPLLAPGIVMIPDFAFSRGDTRVNMEIAGFWSPGYRERKLHKLRALAEMAGDDKSLVPLVIALPEDAAASFEGLPFPLVTYKTKLRATDVLGALDAHFGGLVERQQVAGNETASLQADALKAGFISEGDVAARIQAYTRTELLGSVSLLGGEGLRYLSGAGLFTTETLAKLREALRSRAAAAAGRLDVEEARRIVEGVLSVPVDVEALLPAWQGWRVERPSLFEAFIVPSEE